MPPAERRPVRSRARWIAGTHERWGHRAGLQRLVPMDLYAGRIRKPDSSAYTDRTTDFTLQDVISFRNESTPGVEILGSGAFHQRHRPLCDRLQHAQRARRALYDIRCGSDQDFTLLVSPACHAMSTRS